MSKNTILNILKKCKNVKGLLIIVIAAILALIIISSLIFHQSEKKQEPVIISKASIEKIVDTNDLSTFEAIYNGVAKVMNEKKPDKVDYYVSYNAKVKAGLDFKQIIVEVDTEAKIVTITLPEIKITDVTVDITTLDFIFENNRANTEDVIAAAYQSCIDDVREESGNEPAIIQLAEQNAHNIVEALIKPFVQQVDNEYRLIIK